VEGTGGLLLPIAEDLLSIDLIKRLALPVLLVAPSRKGAINHCMLCVEALRSRSIVLKGVVFNRVDDRPPRPEEAANPQLLEAFAGAIVLGMVPFLPADKRDDLEHLARRLHAHVDLSVLGL
jgi:dethiobiotin synthetase